MIKYIKLTDKENYNMLIKTEGRMQYRYIYGKNEWNRTGILMQYHDERSKKYDLYEEISEKEALQIIDTQRSAYESMYKYAQSEILSNTIVKKNIYEYILQQGGFDDIEINIAGLIYCLGKEYYEEIKLNEKYNARIMEALNILFTKTNLDDEKHLIAIRTNTIAHNIMRIEVVDKYNKGEILKEKYELLIKYFNNEIIFCKHVR